MSLLVLAVGHFESYESPPTWGLPMSPTCVRYIENIGQDPLQTTQRVRDQFSLDHQYAALTGVLATLD